jgi:hypothetical protein
MGGYEVDDLTAEVGEPRASGKRGRKKAVGTASPSSRKWGVGARERERAMVNSFGAARD